MTGAAITRAAGLLSGFAILVGSAQTPQETRVNQTFDKLEAAWLERLDVTESLSAARDDLALLIRKEPSIGRSWQLEPSLAATMSTDEIFQFVVSRANALLACRTAQLARKDLQAPPAPPAGGNPPAAAAADGGGRGQRASGSGAFVSQQLWKNALVEGRLTLSAGCNVLLDGEGQPASLTTKEDVASADRLMRRALRPKTRRQLFEAALEPEVQASAETRLRRNLDYIKREYGGMPERQPELEALLGRKETSVFSRQVLMFEAFIAATATTDRLVLIIPLSE
jgi:hypothetical protein